MIFKTPADVVRKVWMRFPYMDGSRQFWSVAVGGHEYHGFKTENDARFIGQMMEPEEGDVNATSLSLASGNEVGGDECRSDSKTPSYGD